jgi:hypothetical protein
MKNIALIRHVGSQKAASTSIQNFIFDCCDNLQNYGLFIPKTGLTKSAAHAVVNSAGGKVLDVNTEQELKYNSKESLLNQFSLSRVSNDL